MGYELAGAWGARRARAQGEVIAFVGDGSYLMLNSELYSATLAGDRLIVILCDNGGYAVIHRLQVDQGGAAYNNMLEDVRPGYVPVDWVAHARSLGCHAEGVDDARRAGGRVRPRARRRQDVGARDPHGAARLDAGRCVLGGRRPRGRPTAPEVREARERLLAGKRGQRIGW